MKKGAQVLAMLELLEANGSIAEGASMTGALEGGVKALVGSYNQILAVLRRDGMVDQDLFREAPDDSTVDDIGVYSKQLARYIRGYLGLNKSARQSSEEWQRMRETVDQFFEDFFEDAEAGEGT